MRVFLYGMLYIVVPVVLLLIQAFAVMWVTRWLRSERSSMSWSLVGVLAIRGLQVVKMGTLVLLAQPRGLEIAASACNYLGWLLLGGAVMAKTFELEYHRALLAAGVVVLFQWAIRTLLGPLTAQLVAW